MITSWDDRGTLMMTRSSQLVIMVRADGEWRGKRGRARKFNSRFEIILSAALPILVSSVAGAAE